MTGERPGSSLSVPPAPVGGSRAGRRAALVAIVVVAAVIAGAVGLAQLDRGRSSPRRTAAPVVAVATAPPVPTPSPNDLLPGTTPPRMSVAEVGGAVRDRTLDGRIVFVDGEIRATKAPCPNLVPGSGGCVTLEIPGIGVPVRQDDTTIPWPGQPPRGAWLVTVPRAGSLVYLGSLLPAQPLPISRLPVDADPAAAGSVYQAVGWLVVNAVHTCARTDLDSPCPAPPPFLADDQPLDGGVLVSDAGAEVLVAPGPDVDMDTVVTGGTYLVSRVPGTAGRWRVVARYIPANAVRVLVP
jgi:hypothetical protein